MPELRAARHWSQREVANRLGVSRQTVISIERGRYDPSLPLAFRIAAIFECQIEDVFAPTAEPVDDGEHRGRSHRNAT
jgi:putative transcriptional regulator